MKTAASTKKHFSRKARADAPADEQNEYSRASILITGATGSIGGELLKNLLKRSPKRIVVLSNDENGLFETRSQVGGRGNVQFRLADVRDNHSLEGAMKDCDYVFHAAALKHVTFCEGNPYEAITTNIIGTQNVIDNAIKSGVKKFVFISTDKAVNPSSTLGATKLLGEKLVISASKQTKSPIFSIVRFGNVIGSRGSVLVIFEKQVKEGGPITVTNPGMTRFIMAPSEAAELILKAARIANPGEIFVLKMKTVKVGELAEAARDFFSSRLGIDPRKIGIKQIGVQAGEKVHEELMNESETAGAVESEDFYIINPNLSSEAGKRTRVLTGLKGLSSADVPPLKLPQIMVELSHLYDSKAP
jgi:FlaA1/EpsC-like NDP-sugar epimerase